MTEYKYIVFEPTGTSPSGKTKRWDVFSKRGAFLGKVTWHGPWRQYTFWPSPDTIFSAGCLQDIAAELKSVQSQKTK